VSSSDIFITVNLAAQWLLFIQSCWYPVYTIQPVVKLVWQPAVSCKQTSNPTGLTTVLNEQPLFVQPCWTNSHCSFNRSSNWVVQPVWQPPVYMIQPVVKLVWQPAVSCKWGLAMISWIKLHIGETLHHSSSQRAIFRMALFYDWGWMKSHIHRCREFWHLQWVSVFATICHFFTCCNYGMSKSTNLWC